MNIGERLKFLKEQAGISGKALAERSGIVPSQIYKIETGVTKPSLDSLERICATLGVTLADFFAVSPQPINPSLNRLVKAAERLTDEERELWTKLIETMKG